MKQNLVENTLCNMEPLMIMKFFLQIEFYRDPVSQY